MAHKKRRSKYLSFVVVSENQQAPKNFRIRSSLLKAFAVFAITILVLIVIGFSTYWKVAALALDNNRLQEENYKLVQSLKKMETIKEQLLRVKEFEKQIKGSLSGYITIEKETVSDSSADEEFNFAKLNNSRRRTIFRNIPSLQPAEGFMARGYDTSLLLAEPHFGLDIAAPVGTPVRAPADGVVFFSGWTVEGGNILVLHHGYGFMTLYKHNERNLVKRMEKVTQGQIIALTGNTGKISSGPHLHYEVWRNGKPVDPVDYMNKDRNNNG
jgi:murein DD-endopeptidase MepM/ murein hydrolase activator NlpD